MQQRRGGATCWEGNAVELAQDAEVAQRVAVVPGSLAHRAVHIHIGQVHHAGRHDLVCGRLHAMASASAVLRLTRASGSSTSGCIMPCRLLVAHGSPAKLRGPSAKSKAHGHLDSCGEKCRPCALQQFCTTASISAGTSAYMSASYQQGWKMTDQRLCKAADLGAEAGLEVERRHDQRRGRLPARAACCDPLGAVQPHLQLAPAHLGIQMGLSLLSRQSSAAMCMPHHGHTHFTPAWPRMHVLMSASHYVKCSRSPDTRISQRTF